jgi:tetratricopeptide (TPR) repeat protein
MNAKLANENFKLAIENFRKARQAVDEMLTRVAQEHLAHVPAMAGERKKLLQAALNFYQNQTPQGQGDDPDLRRETARALRRVGEINQLLGDFAEADKAFQRTVPMTEALQRDFPKSPDYRQDLGLVYFYQGKLRQKQSQMAAAETAFRKALAVQAQLADDVSTAANRADLARTYNELGQVLRQTNHYEAAKEAYDKAIDIQTRLVTGNRDAAEYMSDLAGSLNDRAHVLRDLKQLEQAEADYNTSLGYLARLVDENRENVQYRARLAAVYQNLGLVLAFIRPADVEEALHKATDLGEELVISFPTVPDFRHELAKALTNLAARQTRQRKFIDAEKNFRQAKEHLDRLIADSDTSPDYRSTMGVTLDYWAKLLRSQGQEKLPEARNRLIEALPHHERALRANATNPAYRQRLANHYAELAEVCLVQDELGDAAKAAQELHKLAPESKLDSRRAAEVLARCAAQAKVKTVAGEFGRQAVQILADAAQRGQLDAAYLQTTKVFDALRGREDFDKIVADVEAKKQ